ncbi:MAG: efflux RND transporter periplasmic adaptor subunit [Limisphaerales bacterium]
MRTSPLSTARNLVLRRPVPLVVGGAILGLVFLSWLLRPKPAGADTATFEVRRGDFTVSIVEGGTLAAVSEVSVRNEVEGTARVIFIVPEGSYVKKSNLLIELDSAQALDQVNQQQIAFEKAQFALIQAEAQLDIQRSTTNSDIRAASLKLDFANLDLNKFLEGQRVVDLIEASNKLVQAEAQLSVNLDNYINTTNLAAKGYETQQRVDSDRLTVLGNRNSLIVASNQMWMLKEFDHKKQFAQFSSAVEEAEKELERVIAQSERRIAQYEADLITQSNTLTLNQRKLERDRRNLDATKIYAPQDGLVVYNVSENRFSSESLIEEGATVRNRQELIKLPDVSRMKVTIKVHESYVNMVSPGLPAFVVLDSAPDQRFAGIVAKVALLPDSQSRWGNPNLKVYNTEVHITDELIDVKPGVSAKAEVIITNIADTLSVPIQAVTTSRGRQVVYVVRGGKAEPRPVEVGMYNTKYIQITSGLKEGERVLLAPPFDSNEKDLEGAVLTDDERARLKTNSVTQPRPNSNPGSAPTTIRPNDSTDANPTADPSLARRGPPGSDPEQPFPRPSRNGPGGPGPDGANAFGRPTGSPGETTAANNPGGRGGFNREEMLKQFDKDGDGTLSEEERSAMREQFGGGRSGAGQRPRGTGGGNGGNGGGGEGGNGRRGNRQGAPAAAAAPGPTE